MAGQAAMNFYNPVATDSFRQTQLYYTYQIYSTVKLWNLCACFKLPYYLTPSIWSLISTHSDKQICTWRGVRQWVTPALSHYGRISVICLCSKEVKKYSFLIKNIGLSWVHYLIEWLLIGSAVGVKCGIVWVSVWVCEWVSEYIVYAVEWMSESWVYTIEWVSESWVYTIEWVYKYGVYTVDCVSECRVGADGSPAGHV